MDNIIKAILHLNEKVSGIDEEVSDIRKEVELLKRRTDKLIEEEWMDGSDVQRALRISPRTLQTMRDSGILIPTRILRKYYYKVADIKTIMEANYTRYHIPTKKHHD